MVTSPTQIRIDSNVKTEANELFSELGIDMSSAVNIFLRQCVLHGGLPFKVEIPKFNTETLAAMEEAKRISIDPNVPSYSSMEDLKKLCCKTDVQR
ncbi:type II toxin-antitoxin system RelB/DinJ family antitoxin [Gardnerella vaginalis]|nr:type II toxin-antitoxin system RelB/DinJ family antitoxin [Gardnerella vaginalis]